MAKTTPTRSALNPYKTGGRSFYEARQTIPATGIRSSRANFSVKSDKGADKGGGPGARGASAEAPKVPTGVEPGEPSAPEYNPIIDAETMSPPVDPNRQEAITNQARMPRFSVGNPNVGNIDLGSLLSSRANPNYDPNAPVGGENVPFQATSGVGGFFRRMFGDTANEQNVAAQQQQKAEWKAEDALAKARQAKREDLAEEINLRTEAERGLKKDERTFTAEQNEALRNFNSAENALDRALRLSEGTADRASRIELAKADRDAAAARLDKELGARASEGAADRAFRSGESAADRAARAAESAENRALTAAHYGLMREDSAAERALRSSEGAADRTLRASEGAANRELDAARLGLQREGQTAETQYRQRPRFERLGENVYTNEKGEVFEWSPGTPGFGKQKAIPGRLRKVPTPGVMAPGSAKGGGNMQVDRNTGLPLTGGLPAPAPEVPNTAILPRFGRSVGQYLGGVATTATDPLRAAGTDVYKTLFSSGAQQDPEVLKRMKARQAMRESGDISMGSDPMFY